LGRGRNGNPTIAFQNREEISPKTKHNPKSRSRKHERYRPSVINTTTVVGDVGGGGGGGSYRLTSRYVGSLPTWNSTPAALSTAAFTYIFMII